MKVGDLIRLKPHVRLDFEGGEIGLIVKIMDYEPYGQAMIILGVSRLLWEIKFIYFVSRRLKPMKVGDLVRWNIDVIFLSKEYNHGLLIRIDHERSYLNHIGLADKGAYSHQVLIGERMMWFKPSDLEVIETV